MIVKLPSEQNQHLLRMSIQKKNRTSLRSRYKSKSADTTKATSFSKQLAATHELPGSKVASTPKSTRASEAISSD